MAHILVVDDEWEILDFVVDQLRSQGHTVLGLNNAPLALEVLRLPCNTFDLILTDVMMPKKNGLEFAREVLKIPHCKQTTFALMSSYSNELKNEIMELGIRHALHKPFNREQIDTFVKRVLVYIKSTKKS